MHFIENHWVYHEIWVFIDSSFLGVPHEAKKHRKKLAVFSASWVGLSATSPRPFAFTQAGSSSHWLAALLWGCGLFATILRTELFFGRAPAYRFFQEGGVGSLRARLSPRFFKAIKEASP